MDKVPNAVMDHMSTFLRLNALRLRSIRIRTDKIGY